MPGEHDADELRSAAHASQEKLEQMVGGGGPASDAEAFVFDAEMIHLLAEQMVTVTEAVEQLACRVESLEARAEQDPARPQ